VKASLPVEALSGWVRFSPQSTDCTPPVPYWLFCRSVLAALFLGSRGDCSHYVSLYIDAMDSISLSEALSPNAWATDVVLSVAALLACCFV
jgi:hypothetical protein